MRKSFRRSCENTFCSWCENPFSHPSFRESFPSSPRPPRFAPFAAWRLCARPSCKSLVGSAGPALFHHSPLQKTPTAFRPPAQGCRSRGYLGSANPPEPNPNGVAPPASADVVLKREGNAPMAAGAQHFQQSNRRSGPQTRRSPHAHPPTLAVLRENKILFSNSLIPAFQSRISPAPRRSAEKNLRRHHHNPNLDSPRFQLSRRESSIANVTTLGVLVLGFRFLVLRFRNSSFVIRNSQDECHTVALPNGFFQFLANSHLKRSLYRTQVHCTDRPRLPLVREFFLAPILTGIPSRFTKVETVAPLLVLADVDVNGRITEAVDQLSEARGREQVGERLRVGQGAERAGVVDRARRDLEDRSRHKGSHHDSHTLRTSCHTIQHANPTFHQKKQLR